MKLKFPVLNTEVKLLSWKSVIAIGLTYLLSIVVTLSVSGAFYLLSDASDGSNGVERFFDSLFLMMAYSIFFASMIGLFIKLVADCASAAYFLKNVTDQMFEPPRRYGDDGYLSDGSLADDFEATMERVIPTVDCPVCETANPVIEKPEDE